MLTTGQVAKRLGVSRQRVDVLLAAGRMPFTWVRGRRFVAEEDVEAFARVPRSKGGPLRKELGGASNVNGQ